jgi:prepilin-type N-terminal cleavage/methylation domain-containing protein
MPRQRGFSKLEFAVVLVIFGVLASLLFDRLVALEHETERLEVDLTVRHINIGIKTAVGERIMRGEEPRIAELLKENPMNFLGHAPAGKVGAGGTAIAGSAANRGTAYLAGEWKFDPGSRILGYQPRQPAAFGGRTNLAWRFTGETDTLGRTIDLRLEPLK